MTGKGIRTTAIDWQKAPESPQPKGDSSERMTAVEHDPDNKLVHVADGYRKAKRNALFWAAVTFLLASGEAVADHKIELAFLVRNFEFDQMPLIGLAVLVLAFMVISYVRAEQNLLITNNDQNYDADQLTAGKAIRLAKVEAEDVHVRASQARNELSRLLERGVFQSTQAAQIVAARLEEAAKLQQQLVIAQSSSSEELRSLRKIELELEQFEGTRGDRAFLLGERSNYLRGLEQAEVRRKEIEGQINKLWSDDDDLSSLHTDIQELIKSVSNIRVVDEKSFTGSDIDKRSLSHRIAKRERRWFFWTDQVPVYGAALVATAVAIWRFTGARPIDWTILQGMLPGL